MRFFITITNKIKGLPLKIKMNIIGIFIIIVFSLILFVMILPQLEKDKLYERNGKLKAVVNSQVSLMDHYERSLRTKAWINNPSLPKTIEEAKIKIIKDLSRMRYDKNECFFILDGSGNMVMHPLKKELEGKNLINMKDPEGGKPFKKMVIHSQRDGETLVTYIWQSKYSETIFEHQTTFAKYYWPWDWTVCTAVYTQDIIDEMFRIKLVSSITILITIIVTMTMLILLIHINLSRPLQKLLSGITEIQNGNLEHQINIASMDEIGFISQQFNHMVTDLKISSENIIRSENKYKNLTDLLPDIVYDTDLQQNITYLNKAGKNLLGYSDSDIAKGLSMKSLISKNAWETFFKFFPDYMDKKNERIFATHKIHSKDGGYIIGENNAAISYIGDEPKGLRGIIRDVTDKLKLEENLAQAQKMETIGTLAGGIAHDFNNALSGIIGSISLLKFSIEQNEEVDIVKLKEFIKLMEESSLRASEMVQQLLTLSRKQEFSFAPVDMNKALEHIIKICQNTFDKSVEIIPIYNDEKAMVYADPTSMEQMLLNICVNANHAMSIMRPKDEAMGGTLNVSIEKTFADKHFCQTHPEAEEIDYWKITISDTGVGMDSKTIAKIFDPFFTKKEKGKGTGLGLAMVYNIMKQHRGFIDVYSELGIGTSFNIFIPILYGNNNEDKHFVKRKIPMGEGLILVIDDEYILRRIAKSILTECGYTVITAEDGKEGIEIFTQRHSEIKAVLLDLIMPKISGEKVYKELLNIDKDVKVLLTSGFKQDHRVEVAFDLGIDGFIQKPFTMRALAKKLNEILKK